jgi:PST family polysaccharide transporter
MSHIDRHFRLDAVHADLRARSVRSGFIAVAARATQILLQIGSVVVLARVLTPEDFGVIALVVPIMLLVSAVTNLGLQTSVIQRDALDQREVSGLFWLGARVNLLVCAAMAAIGPVLARVYEDARVTGVALVWAAILYIATLAAVPEALLKRQLRFGMVLGLHVGALAVATVAAIGAALLGAGYWALLIQVGGMEVGRAGAVWLASGWRPARPSRDAAAGAGVRELGAYWGNLAGYRVLNWLGEHTDRVIVGVIASTTVVGFYDSARRWAWYPFVELYISLSDVAVASFSRLRDDAARYAAVVRMAVTPLLAACLPAIAFLFVEARVVVLVLLGDQWLDAVPYVRLMCVAAFAGSLRHVTTWLYLSRGETRRQLRWALFFQTPIQIAAVIAGVRWGAFGVAAGFTAANVLLALPAVAWCLRVTPISMRAYGAMVWRPVVSALVAALALALAAPRLVAGLAPVVALPVALLLYGIACVAVWLALPGGLAAARELFVMVTALRPRTPSAPAPARAEG